MPAVSARHRVERATWEDGHTQEGLVEWCVQLLSFLQRGFIRDSYVLDLDSVIGRSAMPSSFLI